MPDDSLRPMPGNPPEQSNEAPPVWWGALGRGDLPDDHGQSSNWVDLAATPDPVRRHSTTAQRWIGTLTILVSLTVITLLVVRMTPPQDIALSLIFFGIPTALTGLATILALHRGR